MCHSHSFRVITLNCRDFPWTVAECAYFSQHLCSILRSIEYNSHALPFVLNIIDVGNVIYIKLHAVDFEMTEVQQEHAKAVEQLSSKLAAVHRELCPAFLSEGRFWKIYLVLLHSRISKEDAELLSTPQVWCFRSSRWNLFLFCKGAEY